MKKLLKLSLPRLILALPLTGCAGVEPDDLFGVVEGRVEISISGRRHAPIERNFEVTVWDYERPGFPQALVTAGGWYRIEDVPAGTYAMSAYPTENVSADCRPFGFAGREERVVVEDGNVTRVDLLVDGTSLRGNCFRLYWDPDSVYGEAAQRRLAPGGAVNSIGYPPLREPTPKPAQGRSQRASGNRSASGQRVPIGSNGIPFMKGDEKRGQ